MYANSSVTKIAVNAKKINGQAAARRRGAVCVHCRKRINYGIYCGKCEYELGWERFGGLVPS